MANFIKIFKKTAILLSGIMFGFFHGNICGKATQRERELKAADRIFSLLPEEQGEKLRALWDEFEAIETAEAKFARTMDNIQPMMLNDSSDGLAWREHEVNQNFYYTNKFDSGTIELLKKKKFRR